MKINISLHVLLITTNPHLCTPSNPSTPPPHLPTHAPNANSHALFLSLSRFSHLSTGNQRGQNDFDPSWAEQTDPRRSGTAGAGAVDELELSMSFSVIIVLLGSLK